MLQKIRISVLNNFITVSGILFFFSCNTNSPAPAHSPEKNYKKPASGFTDTLLVNTNTAVFFNADSAQLKKIQAVTEKMAFESSCHDCFYQMRNARNVLQGYWQKIQIQEPAKYRYLLFEKKDKSKILVDLDSKNDMCGIFLFDTVKDPLLIDMMNIDTQLEFYFKH